MQKMFLLILISFSLTHCMQKKLSQEEFPEQAYFNDQTNPSSDLLHVFQKVSGTTTHQEKEYTSIATKNQCPFCTSRCFYLTKHIQRFHPEKLDSYLKTEKLITCPITDCGETIKESNMRRHTILHKKRPYICAAKNCKKKFKTQEDLYTHQVEFQHRPMMSAAINAHSHNDTASAAPINDKKQKLLKCPIAYCSTLGTRSNLWKHIKLHKEKPYMCKVKFCCKLFATELDLYFHQRRYEHEPSTPDDSNTNKRPADDTPLSPKEKYPAVDTEVNAAPFNNELVAFAIDGFVVTGDTPTLPDLDSATNFYKKDDPLNSDGWPL